MEVEISRMVEIREIYALAVLAGRGDRAQLLADMRTLGLEIERARDAIALRKYRNGDPVQAWPKWAPWAGF